MRTLALGKYKLNHRRDPAGSDISFSHPSNPVPSAVKASGDYIIPNLPPLLDQGQLGTCAANAGAGALQVILSNANPPIHDEPSRRLIYWCATSLDGTAGQDEGTYLRSVVQQMHKIGVCSNKLWPYSDNIKSLVPPPPEVIIQASQNRIYGYYKIDSTGDQRLADLCTAIRANHPVIFGTLVGNAFMNTDGRTPLVPERNNEGGHATCLVGVQSTGGRLSFRDKNSWGSSWADGGYCWLDQDYMTWENTSDLWVMTRMDAIII